MSHSYNSGWPADVYLCDMVTVNTFRRICLSFPEVEEVLHWGHPAFRTKRKIFTTLREQERRANFGFTPQEQAAFCQADSESFFPVEGGWGRQGWTTVDLQKVEEAMLSNAIQSAWYGAAPPKLQAAWREKNGL